MTKPSIGTLEETVDPGARQGGYRFEDIPQGEVEVLDMTPGLHLTKARDKRPGGSALNAKNARSREDWIGRRPGTVEFIPGGKPNAYPILAIATVYLDRDVRWVLRVTQNSIHATRSSDAWVAFSGDSNELQGIDKRVKIAQMLRWGFIAGPHKAIVSVDFSNQTYDAVPGAPKAKFLVSYADRLVAANVSTAITGLVSTMVQWSANGDPFEWDPLEDESAGSNPLDSAPGDYGDEITGLAVIGTMLVILRERSLWVVERQPIAADPFRFIPLLAGYGCDLPYTVAPIPGGVIYADRRSNGVYMFRPGSMPQVISESIKSELYADIAASLWIEGAFDPFELEYHLGLNVPNVMRNIDGSALVTEYITKTWVYNLKTQAWTYDIGPVTSASGNVYSLHDLVMVDDLTGTIDIQVADLSDALKPNPDGYIDDWGEDPDELFQPSFFKGTPTGEVVYYTYDSLHEWTCDRFEFVWESQNMCDASKRMSLQDLRFVARCPRSGRMQIAYSKDDLQWKEMKLIRPTPHEGKEHYGVPRWQLTGNQLYWRFTSDMPGVRLHEFWVRLLQKSRQRQR